MSSNSEALATAAHLHVLLRRKTGRVTDTEWMASNPDYARAIIAFTRDKARSENQPDLLPWADKLESHLPAMAAQEHKPLLAMAVERLKATRREVAEDLRAVPDGRVSGFREPDLGSDARYVGGIR